jgi:amidase
LTAPASGREKAPAGSGSCRPTWQAATGQPAMSVPLWWNEQGVGVQFTAAFADEETLFALAGQLERARPRADKASPFGVPTKVAMAGERSIE